MMKHDGQAMADDALLYGRSPCRGLVAVEHVADADADAIWLYRRDADAVTLEKVPFTPFLLVAEAQASVVSASGMATLSGAGPLNRLATFTHWRACLDGVDALKRATGFAYGDPHAPYLFVNDPVQQYLLRAGTGLFHGLAFEELRRLQLDIECHTDPDFDFCNATRASDRIIAIALRDSTGWNTVLSVEPDGERALLEAFVRAIRERDPDIIEGHNLFGFDLPYLIARAKHCKVSLSLGRDGRAPRLRASRFSAGERTIAYDRVDIHGRHVVDTLFLTQLYDVTHRSLDGFGLKDVARHFGLATPDRVYLEGHDIARTFARDPATVLRYAGDDVRETDGLSIMLSPTYVAQARMLPLSYQNVCLRGNAVKIDALMLRAYLDDGQSLPVPGSGREFEGAYADALAQGLVRNVHHADVRSLYPSLMLLHRLAPRQDTLGCFLRLLDRLRTLRLDAKTRMRDARNAAGRGHLDALQTAFKVLINSFYGYLGFSQARFCDFDMAERVTREGRELLHGMVAWLRAHGAQPVEIDTDGIYYVPPPEAGGDAAPAWREAFARALPTGIEIEFDGEYKAMFIHRTKNYALLDAAGVVTIKGGALKSRGLEPFQRDFMRDALRLVLEGRQPEVPALKRRYAQAIETRAWPIERLAKTETLQDNPATYTAKRSGAGRARSAAYELALKAGRNYRAGDQISYYVTGTRKTVAVHEAARLISEWNPDRRDENVPYYLAKLDQVAEKFMPEQRAEDNALGLDFT